MSGAEVAAHGAPPRRWSAALRRAPAPLALMGLIFLLSAQPDLNSGLGLLDTIGRKVVHFATFGLLAALWWWALRPATSRHLAAAALIALVYAVSDEYHQSFVEGRVGSPVDVAIDWAGVAVAALVLRGRG